MRDTLTSLPHCLMRGERTVRMAREMAHALLRAALVPALCGVAVFGPALHGFGFCWDDLRALQQNADVHGGARDGWLNGSLALWGNDFWGDAMDAPESHKSYRPLTVLSFRLDAALGGPTVSSGRFHVVNVLLHGICTGLVGCLALVSPIFSEGDKGKVRAGRIGGASASALLFAVHSVHTEAVAGLVGRADVLCGALFAASIIAFHCSRLGTAIMLGVMSTLCKEIGVTVLGYLAFCEVVFVLAAALDGDGRTTTVGKNQKIHEERNIAFHQSARNFLLLCVSVLSLIVFRVRQNGGTLYKWTIMENHISLESSQWRRAVTYAHTHARYGLFLLFPAPLAFDHGFGCIDVLDSPSPLSVTMYAVLLGTVFRAVLVCDWPVLHCVALALLPFIPASNLFFPVGTILAERLLYVPSIGFCLLCGLLFQRAVDSGSAVRSRAALALASMTFVAMALHTAHSTYAWENELSLYQWGLRAEPNSLTALNNLAYQYMHMNDETKVREAKVMFTRALELHPTYQVALHNLGIVHRKLREDELAIDAFERALELGSNCRVSALLGEDLIAQAETLMAREDKTAASQALSKAQQQLSNAVNECQLPYAEFNLARLRMIREGPSESLVQDLRAVLSANERLPAGRHQDRAAEDQVFGEIGIVLNHLGERVRCAEAFEQAIAFGGVSHVNPGVYANAATMGWIPLFDLHGEGAAFTHPNGRVEPALDRAAFLLTEARRKAPGNGLVDANLGWLLEKKGQLHDALTVYQQALTSIPDHPVLLQNVKRVTQILTSLDANLNTDIFVG